MAATRPDAFAEASPGAGETTGESAGPGCPFAAMVNEATSADTPRVGWTAEAEVRLERVPAFIRPMARKAIERFAEGKGYTAITEQVMEEARGVMGM
jgi:hypothetical protein